MVGFWCYILGDLLCCWCYVNCWLMKRGSMEEENMQVYNTLGLKQYVNSNNELHRIDGPAIEWFGDNQQERNRYYINGKQMTRELFICWYEVVNLKEYTGV